MRALWDSYFLIQPTVEAASTPPQIPIENRLEHPPTAVFFAADGEVPAAPTEEAPSAPVTSPKLSGESDPDVVPSPGVMETSQQKVRELKAEVNRLERDTTIVVAGIAERISYRSSTPP